MDVAEIVAIVKQNINQYLEEYGWSRNELANRTSVAASSMSDWYKKESVTPSLKNLLEISEAFKISLGRLCAKDHFEKCEARQLELLSYFSKFSPEEQESILQMLRTLAKGK